MNILELLFTPNSVKKEKLENELAIKNHIRGVAMEDIESGDMVMIDLLTGKIKKMRVEDNSKNIYK